MGAAGASQWEASRRELVSGINSWPPPSSSNAVAIFNSDFSQVVSHAKGLSAFIELNKF